jgi:ribosome-associated translation inhibitor RaiA
LANEIYATFEEGNTLYALIWRKSDNKVWNDTDGQFDIYTDVDIDKYDVVLVNQADSDYYSVDFPVAIADEDAYRVQIMLQQGTIDADADTGLFQGEIQWNGESEDTTSSLSFQLDKLSRQLSRVNNRYPTRNNPDV